MEGITLLDDSIRPHGYPDWVADDPENMGQFRVKERQDFVAEALDLWRANEPKDRGAGGYGMRQFVVQVPDGGPAPSGDADAETDLDTTT